MLEWYANANIFNLQTRNMWFTEPHTNLQNSHNDHRTWLWANLQVSHQGERIGGGESLFSEIVRFTRPLTYDE